MYLIGTFSGHKGNTSKMMMTVTMLGEVLSLTGHQVGPLQSKILHMPLVVVVAASAAIIVIMVVVIVNQSINQYCISQLNRT